MAKSSGTQAAATSPKALTYFGGAVVSSPKVYAVQWGSGTFYPQLTNGGAQSFFSGTLNSPYVDWLSEYNTTSQHIGRGTFAGLTSITPAAANNNATIDDTVNIAPELVAQIAAGHLQQPDADTIYVLYFRQSQIITQGGYDSQTGFCAYHNTIASTDAGTTVNVRYVVMPYITGAGCGNHSSAWDDMTSVASHELVETMTDPDVGLATTSTAGLGWYNPTYGEIGDICNGLESQVVGGDANVYAVQKQWSNAENTCITTRTKTISVGDQTVLEGNTKTRTMHFPVTLSDPSRTSVTVTYRLGGGTATGAGTAGAGVDYNNHNGVTGTVTFAPGTSGFTPVVKFISVAVYGNTAPGSDRTFFVTLSNPTGGYSIARAQGVGTILEDDPSSGVLLGVGDAAGSAGDLTDRTISVPVTLSTPASTPITFSYAVTGPGAGSAFTAATGTMKFAVATTTKLVLVKLRANAVVPPGEQFTVTISGVNGNGTVVTLARPVGTGSVLS